jgi:PAS domain S-box-containing protein
MLVPANAKEISAELEAIYLLLPDLYCVAATDGYFKRLNPAWTKTLGWSLDELYAKPWLAFVHPDDVEKTVAAAKHLAHGDLLEFENRYLHRDQSYVRLSWRALTWSGGLTYALAKVVSG